MASKISMGARREVLGAVAATSGLHARVTPNGGIGLTLPLVARMR